MTWVEVIQLVLFLLIIVLYRCNARPKWRCSCRKHLHLALLNAFKIDQYAPCLLNSKLRNMNQTQSLLFKKQIWLWYQTMSPQICLDRSYNSKQYLSKVNTLLILLHNDLVQLHLPFEDVLLMLNQVYGWRHLGHSTTTFTLSLFSKAVAKQWNDTSLTSIATFQFGWVLSPSHGIVGCSRKSTNPEYFCV